MELGHFLSLSRKMNLLNKSVFTALHGADSGAAMGILQHLCWQAAIPLVGVMANRLA